MSPWNKVSRWLNLVQIIALFQKVYGALEQYSAEQVTRNSMSRFFLLTISLVASFSFAEEDDFISNFIVGKYILLGKAVDSDATYIGKVEIYFQGDNLKVTRVINGQAVAATAAIESALHGDAQVLRIRFSENDTKYEETCLWQSDLDNYARISCYLYQPGVRTSNPGLEALFYDHTAQ